GVDPSLALDSTERKRGPSRSASREAEGTGPATPRQPARRARCQTRPGAAREDVSSDREGAEVSATQTRNRFLERLEQGPAIVDAIEAIRTVSKLPIVALLTFDEGAETIAGITPDEAAERLAGLEVAAIGANHGAGLLAALAALERMGKDGKPLAALPNVGLASLAGGRVIYPHAAPEYFAEFAAHARELGARVIGGCCGTTPAEIAAIRAAVE